MNQDKIIYNLSIISANFNNGRYLSDFINSIINSNAWPKEVIIVDDGSTDGSLDILDAFKDVPFLKVLALKQNQGLSRALNAALELAQAEYIMRADPDDLLLPDRIATQMKYMKSHPDIDILGSNVLYFNDINNKAINRSHFPLQHASIVRFYQRGEHGIQHPTACIKASVFKQFRYTPGLSPTEDYDIFSRMAIEGYRFANLRNVLYKMRVHPGSSTSNTNIQAIQQTFQYRDRLWGTHTSKWHIWRYYQHIYHYRRYQLSKTGFRRCYHLLLSATFYPRKVAIRLFNMMTSLDIGRS